ncbi:MAG: hypothetical protein KY393_04795, partial [Actinobacteria bacterium]|nr:hypothetical protein [Actinomycetota bacterium]
SDLKEIERAMGVGQLVSYTVKPNFKALGPRFGPRVRSVADAITASDPKEIVDALESDGVVHIDGSTLEPMITYGTNPGMGMAITGVVPDPDRLADRGERESAHRALQYMGLTPGRPLAGTPVDPQVAAKLRVLAQMKHGLSSIDGRTVPGMNSGPGTAKDKGRLLDTEIIAIYW